MKILVRHRKGSNKTNEYFLNYRTDKGECVYYDWMTGKEIAALPECDLTQENVKAKIKAHNNGSDRFENCYELITHSREKSGITAEKKRHAKPNPEWIEFVHVLTMWPHGSLTGKPLQAKQY